jgi:DNA-binding LacI/PurR family transcriptional regulator
MLFPWIGGEDFISTYRELITSNRVDGFILSSVDFNDPRIPFLREMDFPFVTFGRTQSEPNYPYVDVDGRAGTRAAAEHLIAQGHEKIAVLAWPESSRVGLSRLNGFREAMQVAGIQIDDAWIRRADGTLESAYTNTKALLDLPKHQIPTAIVTMVDIMALGASQAIQEYGYVVGKDIGVTGFDDTSFSRHVRPSLTTLHQPVEKGSSLVIELLMDIIHKGKVDQNQFLLQPELIIRESSLR